MFGQVRLAIAGAVALAFAGVVIAALWYRAEAFSATEAAADARKQFAAAVEANHAAEATIDALQEQARLDSRLTASLLDQVRQINDGVAAQAARLDDLRKSNAAIQSFLDAAVPADLGKLYGHAN